MSKYSEANKGQQGPLLLQAQPYQAHDQFSGFDKRRPKYFQTVKGANIALHGLNLLGLLVILFTFTVVDLRKLLKAQIEDKCSLLFYDTDIIEKVRPIVILALVFATAVVALGLFGIWRESYLITSIYLTIFIIGYVRSLIDTLIPSNMMEDRLDQCRDPAAGRTALELIEDWFELLFATLILVLLVVYYRGLWQIRQWKIAEERAQFAMAGVNKV